MIPEPEIREQYRQILKETIFRTRGSAFLETPQGEIAMRQHLYVRYEQCLKLTLPWLRRCMDLKDKKILEIGCGSGSISAALASACGTVCGYDINAGALNAAGKRFELLELSNACCRLLPENHIYAGIKEEHSAKSFDVVILFALLEHMTIEERLEALRFAWEMTTDNGYIVVGETPNRLIYYDGHSSYLHFFHFLPDELALQYFWNSPRQDFIKVVSSDLAISPEQGRMRLTRFGRGVSYHEFELALGDMTGHIMLDGFEPEIMKVRGMPDENECFLYSYFLRNNLPAPLSFTRRFLDLVIGKKLLEHPLQHRIPLQFIQPRKTVNVQEKDGVLILQQPGSSLTYTLPEGSRSALIRLHRNPLGGVLRIQDENGRLMHEEDLFQPHWSTEFIPFLSGTAASLELSLLPSSQTGKCFCRIESILIR